MRSEVMERRRGRKPITSVEIIQRDECQELKEGWRAGEDSQYSG